MTTVRKVLVESQEAPTVQTDLYTADAGVVATLDRPTATNTTGGVLTISVNLVPAAGTADATNLFVKSASLAAGASYDFPEIAGQDLGPGESLSVLASAAGIAFRVSGREHTSG